MELVSMESKLRYDICYSSTNILKLLDTVASKTARIVTIHHKAFG